MNLASLEAKYDRAIPNDELAAALKTQQSAWAEARYWMHYHEARLKQIHTNMEMIDDTHPLAAKLLNEYADKAAFNAEQADMYRAEALRLDWQKRERE